MSIRAPSIASLYEHIADEALMGILTLDLDGTCIYANQLAHDMLEFPMDYDLNKFHVRQIYPEQSYDPRMKKLNSETLDMQGLIQEIVISKLNGQQFIATLGIKKIQVDEKTHLLLMIQDVTLQKKMQREITEKQTAINQAYQDLLHQNKQLKELDIAKNRFIAVTTHELRTPLSAMVASAEILKLKMFDNQEQHDEFVDIIYDQGQHLLNLVNDILDFAKIQSDKMDYFIEEKDLYPVVRNEVEALQSMASNSKITLTLDAPKTLVKCYFDEVRIRQVLTNLINNAIKYNRPNGSVHILIKETTELVQVFVQDTGKGISPEDQPKVFNEFETLGKVAHHAKGTGLGLPISQRMIKSMGGDIKLESTEGTGSTFWIEVPKIAVLPAENYRRRPDDSGSGDLAA